MRIFWEYGFGATSIAQLTAALGIAAPSLYAAFGDKKALFREVVATYGRMNETYALRSLTNAATARQGVELLLREAAEQYTDPANPRGCLIVTGATNCAPEDADVQEWLREIRNANVRAIELRIRVDIDHGLLPPDTNARTLAVVTAAAIQGMSQQARDGATRDELLAVTDAAMRAWPPASLRPAEAPLTDLPSAG